MNQKVMLVEKERFLLNDNCKYMITGRVSKEADIECYLDGIRLPSEANLITVMTGFMRAVETKNPGGKWVEVLVTLPENLQNYKKLEVYAVNGKERFLWYKMKTPDLMRKQGKPQLFVDGESIVREQKKVILAGWAVGTTPVSLQVYDENKKPVKITLKRNTRMDVAEMFRECEVNKDCGFHIQAVPYETHPADRPRQCVFGGTSNALDFLPLDRSGNRRFIPVMVYPEQAEVHILEDEAASRAYIEQMWAEAMEIYRSGRFKLAFSPAMQRYLKEHQRAMIKN